MQEAFAVVVIVVAVGGTIVAALTLISSGSAWREIGRGGLSLNDDDTPSGRSAAARAPAPDTPAARAERDAEARQMLEARNERRVRKGEQPLDVEAELRRLTEAAAAAGPGADAALRDEVRQLVLARNARRARKGEAPLDVDAEVERQLREL